MKDWTMDERTAQDFRDSLDRELSPKALFGIGPRQRTYLLDGYAERIRREEAERVKNEPPVHRAVLTDALTARGYAPHRAAMMIREFSNLVADEAVRNSDHESYRVLADALGGIIREVSDPDHWDGDDSEEYILCQFLAWLPDLVRHADAEKLRERARQIEKTERERFGSQDHETVLATDALKNAADDLDPFERCIAGGWDRKSDGASVPGLAVEE